MKHINSRNPCFKDLFQVQDLGNFLNMSYVGKLLSVWRIISDCPNQPDLPRQMKTHIKSVHFTVTRSSICSKIVVIFVVVTLKMTTLFERNEDRVTGFLKWADFSFFNVSSTYLIQIFALVESSRWGFLECPSTRDAALNTTI